MDIKYRINKIHGDLIASFGEATIKEGSSKELGNYFNISVISEGKEVKILISKSELQNDSFRWSYSSNPLLESSHMVERNSNVSSICSDIRDIIEKLRFDDEYIKNIGI